MKFNRFVLKGVGCVSALLMLVISYYLEGRYNLHPCPLCVMQRLAIALLVLLWAFDLVYYRHQRPAKWLLLSQYGTIALGLFFSGRQLWLQSLPEDKVPACMPDLSILWQYFPWQDIARAMVLGGGDCAEITFLLLGLSLAMWAFLSFLFMLFLMVLNVFQH